jgi:hypothetical protein
VLLDAGIDIGNTDSNELGDHVAVLDLDQCPAESRFHIVDVS